MREGWCWKSDTFLVEWYWMKKGENGYQLTKLSYLLFAYFAGDRAELIKSIVCLRITEQVLHGILFWKWILDRERGANTRPFETFSFSQRLSALAARREREREREGSENAWESRSICLSHYKINWEEKKYERSSQQSWNMLVPLEKQNEKSIHELDHVIW